MNLIQHCFKIVNTKNRMLELGPRDEICTSVHILVKSNQLKLLSTISQLIRCYQLQKQVA
jgi:hypothetical protein